MVTQFHLILNILVKMSTNSGSLNKDMGWYCDRVVGVINCSVLQRTKLIVTDHLPPAWFSLRTLIIPLTYIHSTCCQVIVFKLNEWQHFKASFTRQFLFNYHFSSLSRFHTYNWPWTQKQQSPAVFHSFQPQHIFSTDGSWRLIAISF